MLGPQKKNLRGLFSQHPTNYKQFHDLHHNHQRSLLKYLLSSVHEDSSHIDQRYILASTSLQVKLAFVALISILFFLMLSAYTYRMCVTCTWKYTPFCPEIKISNFDIRVSSFKCLKLFF